MKEELKLISTLICLVLVLTTVKCSDDTRLGLSATDNIPPSTPKIVKVDNINGGAIIYYDIPKESDLMYVVAEYTINNVEYGKMSSPYVDSIKVEGFGNDKEYSIKIYSVDKSRNKSDPTVATINPLKPPVELIFESLKVIPSFGGIKVSWDNPTESNIIVNISVKDSLDDWIELESFYSSTRTGSGSVRGLDTIPKMFGIKIRDRWDNYSNLLEQKEQPLFETLLDKGKFREVTPILPNDAPALNTSFAVSNIWDGIMNTSEGCYHSLDEGGINKFITFDLGQTAKLSRYKMWERVYGDSWTYSHNNLKRYNIYGCKVLTADMRATGSLDGWTLLYEALTYKPSGEGPVTNEDKEYIRNGDEHEFPLEIPSVRFIRIHMLETWSGGLPTQIGEMTFWGQPD